MTPPGNRDQPPSDAAPRLGPSRLGPSRLGPSRLGPFPLGTGHLPWALLVPALLLHVLGSARGAPRARRTEMFASTRAAGQEAARLLNQHR